MDFGSPWGVCRQRRWRYLKLDTRPHFAAFVMVEYRLGNSVSGARLRKRGFIAFVG
jgi:hypothetical protein